MRLILAILSALMLAPEPLTAQTPAPAAAKPAYRIAGFRSARFGMTPAEVRTAIAADLGAGRTITDAANTIEGTMALQVAVPDLPPGPGAATVNYIFGATSKRLASISVVWLIAGEATAAQRDAVSIAAVQLADYFRALPIRTRARADVAPLGPSALLMFAAVDDLGAGVELVVAGIPFKSDTTAKAPAVTGPASLRITYVANAANPDVRRIAPGSF